MVQVIGQGRTKPSNKSQQFFEAFSNLAQGAGNALMQNQSEKLNEEKRLKENALIARLTGRDENELQDLRDDKIRQELVGSYLKAQNKDNSKELEKVSSLQSALETVNVMKDIRKRGNLGFGSSVTGLFSPETRKDRGEYERLGKSLIQYSTNIPIRNKQEFETLAHDLYDPSITDAEAEGILDAMVRIIENAMRPHEKLQGGQSQNFAPSRNPSNKKRSLTSFVLG